MLDAVIDCAPGTPDRLFQCAVPIVPQRFPGYLHVIRYPSILGGLSEPCAAVVLDLTSVGGRYFATVLPTHLEYHSLLAFLAPFASQPAGEMCIYVGARTRPWPSAAEVVFAPPAMPLPLFGPRLLYAIVLRLKTSSLVIPLGGPCSNLCASSSRRRLAVLYGAQRYAIPRAQIQGELVEQAILRLFQLDPAGVLLCTFPTAGLEIQGFACPTVVAIADKPTHPPAAPPVHRQDIFTYCDLRPLGVRPRCIRTNVPVLHLPTLASDFRHLSPACIQVRSCRRV